MLSSQQGSQCSMFIALGIEPAVLYDDPAIACEHIPAQWIGRAQVD